MVKYYIFFYRYTLKYYINEIAYEESIVNKSRAETYSFRHFTIDVAYMVLVICVSRKT